MLTDVIEQSVLITSFVIVMMVIVEYFNVLSRGDWLEKLAAKPALQYLLAGVLGVLPGCLGAFSVVAMYSHGVVSLGALVAAMIATSGDESFVMLATIPKETLLLSFILLLLGISAGWTTDRLMQKLKLTKGKSCDKMSLHGFDYCKCFSGKEIVTQWRRPSRLRLILTAILAAILYSTFSGYLGPPSWNWIRITLIIVTASGLFIIVTVPEHFLRDHLWKHVVISHATRILLWTAAALMVSTWISMNLDITAWLAKHQATLIVVAAIVGIIPESGPHLIFVTMFAKGSIPFSVLLVNSIVQDGHGLLPLLGQSRRDFVVVKGINLVVGLIVGLALLLISRLGTG